MARNNNLHEAKVNARDCFYTQDVDVENELRHYKKHFKDKVIYCNADDVSSAFYRYFHLNFNELGLKKLIATHYDDKEPSYKLTYLGENDNDISVAVKAPLKQNGDFRSEESIELLKEADILVTNPAFSLWRKQFAQVIEYKKDFILWANNNAITYKEVFPYIKNGVVKAGYMFNKTCYFEIPEDYPRCDEKYTAKMSDGKRYAKVPAITVFTTLDIPKHHEELILWKKFNQKEYQMYDNYPAWNVDKVSEIPVDKEIKVTVNKEKYEALKATYLNDCLLLEEQNDLYLLQINNPIYGVPITILDKFNPKQFEIISFRKGEDGKDLAYTREREREFNRTFESLYDIDCGDDKKRRRKNQWEAYICKNNNQKEIEPIDFFFPNSMAIGGCMNNPKDTKVNGKQKYARILIRRKYDETKVKDIEKGVLINENNKNINNS